MDKGGTGVCFNGPAMYFSDALLAAVARELSDSNIFRTTELGDGDGDAAKVILTPLEIVTDIAGYMEDAAKYYPRAHVALIYDNNGAARSFFASNDEVILRGGISLIPMNVRLDVWLLFIRLFLLGQTYLSIDLVIGSDEDGKGEQAKAAAKIVGKLTHREAEILKLAARGAQNKVIAERLGITEHTVKLHMHHVIRKMKAYPFNSGGYNMLSSSQPRSCCGVHF